jgi:hypothetical protein
MFKAQEYAGFILDLWVGLQGDVGKRLSHLR